MFFDSSISDEQDKLIESSYFSKFGKCGYEGITVDNLVNAKSTEVYKRMIFIEDCSRQF